MSATDGNPDSPQCVIDETGNCTRHDHTPTTSGRPGGEAPGRPGPIHADDVRDLRRRLGIARAMGAPDVRVRLDHLAGLLGCVGGVE